MHGSLRVFAAMALVLPIAACNGGTDGGTASTRGGAAPAEVAPPADAVIVARVGKAGGVTAEDFAEAASRTAPRDLSGITAEERREILEQLIVDEALFQEAAKRGLHRDPKVRKMMINLLMREEVYAKVRGSDFSPEEMRAYFEAHKEEFVVPEKVQILRIFLETGDKRSEQEALRLATDLRARVLGAAGKDRATVFKELAVAHSEDPYKRRGGDIGFVSQEGKPGIDPAVTTHAFGLPEFEVSEPFAAGGGVNLILVPKRRERVERTFEQMKGSVLRKLKNERYKELTQSYISEVRKDYPVEIDESALSEAPLRPGRTRTSSHEEVDVGEEPEEDEVH